ncbi:D-alanyl-D-alanine carboxypeptidase/D-alanyl-D-alanine-endopeptidase [Jiangella asiatica]|nr:D-alanyl-D-alanine carboxypeptidase/D-alanyl-D-alanine-endopeptidase [Jiangella asiatica]
MAAVPFAASGLVNAPGVANAASDSRTETSPYSPTLEARISEIIGRPVFSGATWAMRYQDVGASEPIFALSSDRPMRPASTMKVFISGTAHERLGPDHRFRTRVYRTGPIARGVLKGDLVLVAGGDLLLGGRVQPDGSLWLKAQDHSYGGEGVEPVPGDPIQSLRDLADQVAARGVRRIEGRVLVDASLFRQGEETTGNGSVQVSPMMINDNIVDVIARPGGVVGAPAVLEVTPQLGYVDIINEVTTVAPEETVLPLRFVDDVEHEDGTHTVRLTGSVPLSAGYHTLRPYAVPGPVRFAELAFAEALRGKGIRATSDATSSIDPKAMANHRRPEKLVAELVSPPLSEAVKVMLKLSSNPHTAHWPYVVGAIAGHEHDNPEAVYEEMRSTLFTEAGLDPHPPGSETGLYSPDHFVQFLTHMAGRPYMREYHDGLPIMGVDGTLAHVQVNSPAAGHVHAKTGGGSPTSGSVRALAGYIDLPGGRRVAFGSFIEKVVATPEEGAAFQPIAMEALGEIATAVYEEETS